MLYIILIIVIIFILFFGGTYEGFAYYLEKPNYANDVYSIAPPYDMARLYSPDELGPIRILKHNFLNYPIEG